MNNEVVVILNDPVRVGEIAAREYLDETKRTQRHIEAMALGLTAARERYPLDIDFGEWLRDSAYWDLGKNDRAALIKLGQNWSDALREKIAALSLSSPRLIVEQLYGVVSQDGKPGINVTDDDEEDDDSGFYGAPRIVRSNEAWDTIDPRLTAALLHVFPDLADFTIWEPAAGCGLMVDQLRAAGANVIATDLVPRRDDVEQEDFFAAMDFPELVGVLVTNPPWGRLLAPFVRHAVKLSEKRKGFAAALVPLPWITGGGIADLTGHDAFDTLIIPRFRARWMTEEEEAELKAKRESAGKNGNVSPKMNHVWAVWDFEREPGPAQMIFVDADQCE